MSSLFEHIQRNYHTRYGIPDLQGINEHVNVLEEVTVTDRGAEGWTYSLSHGDSLPCITTDEDYQNIILHMDAFTKNRTGEQFLLRTAFECRFCYEGIVSLHGACVEVGEYAVIFTGPSGVGKSTRAQAWVDGLGAQMISGDRPAVRIEEDYCIACGVPWDGKEQIFRDIEKPLKCILEVRRSSANYVRKLSRDQARSLLAQQVFVPMWDTDAAFAAMANVREMVDRIPVYRVFCGPKPEDAKQIYDILFNHPEWIREEAKEMKIKDGFVLRNVIDEYMVMPTGENIAKFEGAVVLNEVSAMLYKLLEKSTNREDLLTAMLNQYDVDEETASTDLDEVLEVFDTIGILEK